MDNALHLTEARGRLTYTQSFSNAAVTSSASASMRSRSQASGAIGSSKPSPRW